MRATTRLKGPCNDFQVFWDRLDQVKELKGENTSELQSPFCLSKATNAWHVVCCLYRAKS